MRAHRTSRLSRLTIPFALGFLLIAGAMFVAKQQPKPEVLAGQVSVIDGDTIRVAGQTVRLQGLAAPELHELGGLETKNALIELVRGQHVTCELDGTTSYDRVVGICYAAGQDLAAELIRWGLARDCARYSGGRYRELEPASAAGVPLPGYCAP